MRFALALLVALGAALTLGASPVRSTPAQDLPVGAEEVVDASLLAPEHWSELLAFDREASFVEDTAFKATLVRDAPTASERAAAIYALSRSGNPAALRVIRGLYGRVRGPEEVAVVFALSEQRPLPLDLLLDVGKLGSVEHLGHVAVGLVLSDDPQAADAVLRMEFPGTPLGYVIDDARRFDADPTSARGVAPLGDYLELRRQAAMRFGRVGGEPWRARRLRELENDEDWLARLIVPLGARVDRPWTKDHLLTTLLERPRPSTYTACVESMGEPLVRLVESGLWAPADAQQWHLLLDAVEDSTVTAGFAGILQRAARSDMPPEIRQRAACLSFAAGLVDTSDATVRDLLDTGDLDQKEMALRSIADSPVVDSLAIFDPFLEPEAEPRLRAVALVGVLARSPNVVADRVRQGLVEDETLRLPLTRELVRRSVVPTTASALLLASTIPSIPFELGLDVHAALARQGVGTTPGQALGSALSRGVDGPVAARALLALDPLSPLVAQDAAVDALLYARDDALTLVAGRLLVEARHPIGISLLRRSLWIRDVPVSQLAAGYLIEQEGTSALERETDSPPSWARDEDLRRLGLALGEWGGYGLVQRLARRRNVRDPVLQGAYLGALASRTR